MNSEPTKMIIKNESIWIEPTEYGINYTTYKILNDLVDKSPVSFGNKITLFNSFTIGKNEHLNDSQILKDVLYSILLKFADSKTLSEDETWANFLKAVNMMTFKGLKTLKEELNEKIIIIAK